MGLVPSIALEPVEDSDWDCARAKKVMVRSPSVEWSSSVRSVKVEIPELGDFVVPNRNMPVEGLSVLLRGEMWKAIDGVGISWDDSRELQPSVVNYSLLSAQYRYETSGDEAVAVAYYPADAGVASSGGLRVCLNFPEREMGSVINLYFLVDLRPLKRTPIPVDFLPEMRDGLLASSSGAKLGVLSEANLDASSASRRELSWRYRMGYGFRTESVRGVVFAQEERPIEVLGPYRLRASSPSHELLVVLSEKWPPGSEVRERMRAFSSIAVAQLETVLSSLPAPSVSEGVKEALYGRIAALLSFGIRPEDAVGRVYGEAGSHWFREVWFRDIFEGLLRNIRTLTLLGLSRFIRDQLDIAMEFADRNGMIPNNLSWESGSARPSYDSIDSTLLFHDLLLGYGDAFGDADLLRRGLRLLERFLKAVQAGEVAGVRLIDGSLLSPPNYSWTDSRTDLAVKEVHLSSIPCRVPTDWIEDMLSDGLSPRDVESAVKQPVFLMPEVQARFTLLLMRYGKIARSLGADAGSLQDLERASSEALEANLMGESTGLPPTLVMFDRGSKRVDRAPSSMSLCALAMLKDLVPLDRIRAAYDQVRSELIVQRRMMRLGSGVSPFGVMVQRRSCEPYFGDRQYHGCVVWPRDTPYLIDVMEKLGLYEDINRVLLNNLDASASEVIPFYMNELYGPPLGKNPNPSPSTAEQPIPLKNPAQFWSMWVDPYLRWFVS